MPRLVDYSPDLSVAFVKVVQAGQIAGNWVIS
jgi:hypothetical protein